MRIYLFDLKCLANVSKVLKLTLLCLLIFSVGLSLSGMYLKSEEYKAAVALTNDRKTIIIDAGHGGEDCGTIGVGGVYEKDLNLSVSLMLGDMLNEHGYAVVYTRTEDKLLYTEEENIYGIRKISDLKNRTKIAAEYENSIFVSIHMNSYSNPKYSGLQVYYSSGNDASYSLASCIQLSVKSSLQKDNNRKIKPGENIYILENIDNPAVLIECGFLSNPEECKRLSEKEYQKSLCFSILCGIIEYNNKTSNA